MKLSALVVALGATITQSSPTPPRVDTSSFRRATMKVDFLIPPGLGHAKASSAPPNFTAVAETWAELGLSAKDVVQSGSWVEDGMAQPRQLCVGSPECTKCSAACLAVSWFPPAWAVCMITCAGICQCYSS